MNRTNLTKPQPAARLRVTGWVAVFLVLLVLTIAYGNSFQGAFVFDDQTSIPANESIRHLWSGAVLHPPAALGATVGGAQLRAQRHVSLELSRG